MPEDTRTHWQKERDTVYKALITGKTQISPSGALCGPTISQEGLEKIDKLAGD